MKIAVRTSTFSPFIQYLTSFPDPDEAAEAIVRGPLASFGCQRLTLWTHLRFEELVCIGSFGLSEEFIGHYLRVPLTFETPLTHSFVSSSTVVLRVDEVLKNYPALEMDRPIWEEFSTSSGNGDLGHQAIISNGVPVGAFSFLCNRQNEWSARELDLLNGLSAVLALWMSQPKSGVPNANSENGNYEGLTLSPRQIEILKLVGDGKSNVAISNLLGYSQSTIKQELQRVMKRLRVHTREEALTRSIELQLMPQTASSKP